MAQKPLKGLSSIPLFSDLDKKGLEMVIQAAASKHYAAGETLFWQSEACAGLYIVQEGWLKAVIGSPSGREQIIRLLGPGDTFNEIGLLTDGKNPVTVRALEESRLWVIERETILRLMDEHPGLCRAITRNLAERVQHLMKLIEDLSLRTVKSRMARILLENAVDGVINRHRWMTQTEMAARLGTVLDVANRSLTSLESAGLVKVTRYEIQILDTTRLEELAILEE
jgi:CRP/FNR family transcriptional regulator